MSRFARQINVTKCKMSYETSEGKVIKSIEINVSCLEKIFDDCAKKFSFEFLSVLDLLEYEIVNGGQITELEEE